MSLIEFRNVYKAFGPKVIYAGLNLSIERGEALTIVGGSGVGVVVPVGVADGVTGSGVLVGTIWSENCGGSSSSRVGSAAVALGSVVPAK